MMTYIQDPLPGIDEEILRLGITGVQNGVFSVDEVREKLELPPWGMPGTSEPVVFTAQGPVPFSKAPELIRKASDGDRIKKLERLVKLLTDWNARSEEITSLRRELNL